MGTETPAMGSPDWTRDETICPCGEKAGPEFRYGLCDKHAHETPPVALLRWGITVGGLLKQISDLERTSRQEIDGLKEHLGKMIEWADLHVREVEGIAADSKDPADMRRARAARAEYDFASAALGKEPPKP